MIFIVSDIIVLPHFSDTNCYLKFKYYIECFDIFILRTFLILTVVTVNQKFKYDIDRFDIFVPPDLSDIKLLPL